MVTLPHMSLKRSIIVGVLALVTIASLSGLIYFYLQYQRAQLALTNPTLAQQQEAQSILTKVGSLMVLPQNEQPQIATVSDVSKLKDQSFFQDAKNGDKVLFYTKAKQAILYDPILNKIIRVAPLSINTQSPTLPAQVRVALYNGTTVAGLASKAETFLTAKFSNITVVDKATAAKTDYSQTEVIDLTGKMSDFAKQIAQAENGQVVATFPTGEIKPDADILVILAK